MRHHIEHAKHHEQEHEAHQAHVREHQDMLKRSKRIALLLGVNMAMAIVILALYALNLIGEMTGRW